MQPATIIGGPVSPYVRKIMAACILKGVPYRIDPIIPFQGNDDFTAVSPLRRIPVFIDDLVTLADSTVIGEYLEDRHPVPPLFPRTPAARSRARCRHPHGRRLHLAPVQRRRHPPQRLEATAR
jgi:glutathione S-transferase